MLNINDMRVLSENTESYIVNRLDQYQNWYDNKAVITKKRYLRGKIWAAVGAVIVPILTNIPIDLEYFGLPSYDLGKLLTTIIATFVALLIALESVLHYREQWKNYRTTEQYLVAQKNLFLHQVGDYSNLNEDDAFKKLVLRIETAISEENAITLNVLTKNSNSETIKT